MAKGKQFSKLAREVGTIVLSILVAFAIDRGWERTQEQEDLDAVVELLRADVETNLIRLREARQQSATVRAGLAELLHVIDGTSQTPSPDSLRALVRFTIQGPTYDPTSAAYDAAAGADAWNLIPAEIKVGLADILAPRNQELVRHRQASISSVAEIMGRYGGLRSLLAMGIGGQPPPPPQGDLLELIADPEFNVWVTNHYVVLGTMMRELDDRSARFDGVHAQLELMR